MKSDIQNLDAILDQSLKTAARIVAIIAFPAVLIAGYRNLFIDFLPYHQAFLSLCVGLFFFLGFGKIKSNTFRFNIMILVYLLLFIVTGIRNSSIIFVDVFLILACGLMAFKFSSLVVIISGIVATLTLFLMTTETFVPSELGGLMHSSIVAVHLSALGMCSILVFSIRKVVDQYQNIYLKEIEQNKSLIQKNKSSYDLVAEAQESSEAEKQS